MEDLEKVVKQKVSESISQAQQIIASNMHLLDSIDQLNSSEFENDYADIMTAIDKFLIKLTGQAS